LKQRRGEAGEGRGRGQVMRGGRRSMRRGAGPDRRGTVRATRQQLATTQPRRARAARCVRTGEASGPLTHRTWPAAGEGGRREARGTTREKAEWAEPG
jgi:hypothetical protein